MSRSLKLPNGNPKTNSGGWRFVIRFNETSNSVSFAGRSLLTGGWCGANTPESGELQPLGRYVRRPWSGQDHPKSTTGRNAKLSATTFPPSSGPPRRQCRRSCTRKRHTVRKVGHRPPAPRPRSGSRRVRSKSMIGTLRLVLAKRCTPWLSAIEV